jgi:hypothetical protein
MSVVVRLAGTKGRPGKKGRPRGIGLICGTAAKYWHGCRCFLCRAAKRETRPDALNWAEYMRDYRAGKRRRVG